MNQLLPAIFVVSCVAASACREYQSGPNPMLQTPEQFRARTLENALAEAGIPHPTPSWDLDSLTFVAFQIHPDLQTARAAQASVQAAVETAGQSPNPTFSFSPQYISNAGTLPMWTLGFNLDWQIETAGKRDRRIEQANRLAEIAALQALQTAWTVRGKLRDAFLALYKAKRLEELLRQEQSLLIDNQLLLSGRFQSGAIGELVASDAETLSQKGKVVLTDASRKSDVALKTVAGTIGLPPSALHTVVFDFRSVEDLPRFDKQTIQDATDAALRNRADLLSALKSFEAAHAALELELAKLTPDIHLGPDFTWDQGAHKWGIFFSGPLPINPNSGPAHEAEAKWNEAAAKFAGVQDQVIGEIGVREAQYQAELQKLASAEEAMKAQQKQHESLKRLLRPGDVARPALLKSLLAVSAAKQARLDAMSLAQLSLGQLEDALQCALMTTHPSVLARSNPPQPAK